MTHHLESGHTDTYQLLVSSEVQVVADVTDTSGTIGLLQLTPQIFCPTCPTCPPCPSTCDGSAAFATGNVLDVSDCIGTDAGDYAIEFNVVQQSPENCGISLSCGVAPAGTALSVPGEVDAYTFGGIAGQQISLTTTATNDTTGSLRMRLFSPTGDLQSDSCSGSLTYKVPSNGTYTALVSACVKPSIGPYTIVWQTLPACPAPTQAAFAYVAYANSGTVAVIDLATNHTVSIVPGLVQPHQDDPVFAALTMSPNSGFACATFSNSGVISIINTTLNRVIGSTNVPSDGSLNVSLDPQGRYVYAASDVLTGVVVINTATRKSEAVIRLDEIYAFPDGAAIAVSPDGKFLYVAAIISEDPGPPLQFVEGLIVIDTASRTVVGQVTDPRYSHLEPLDISFNPTATLAYVTQNDGLYVVDTATRSITQRLPLFVNDITFSRDGTTAYGVGCVAPGCDEYGVFVIDMSTLMVTKTISVQRALGGFGSAVALSPDGGRLVVLNSEATAAHTQPPAAVVIDTATSQIVATIPAVGDGPFDVAIVSPPTGLCTADDTGQTRVTVGELVSSVNYSVDGCPTARSAIAP